MFVVIIYTLWYKQALFESKWDKLSSSAECRIRTQGIRHQIASRLNARWQTHWPIGDQNKTFELYGSSLWSASIQPTRLHCQLAFTPGSGDIHVCCCKFRCSGTGKRYSNRKKTSCLPLLNAGFEPRITNTKSPADLMSTDIPTELSKTGMLPDHRDGLSSSNVTFCYPNKLCHQICLHMHRPDILYGVVNI